MLEGEAALAQDTHRGTLTDAHVAFLPPGYTATVTSESGGVLLYGEIPDAASLDPGITTSPPAFCVIDWTREPVLDSEHDARKRIYLVTPKLFGTKVVKGEMIIYPPGTAAANHHHVGAEHFMYVLRGRGTVYANEKPFAVRKGDVIYYPDLERHYLEAAPDEELVFAEYFAPGEFRTVWVDDSEICTWKPTGRDIRGQTPAREIKAHSSADVLSPGDV
jgi:quercetin dioxygenase-like cupin family protein